MVFGSSDISVGKYRFIDRVNSVDILKGRTAMVATATIKLPNLKNSLSSSIAVGDEVVINLGYNDNLYQEFAGYVSRIVPGYPYTLEVMDEMWKQKQRSINKAYKSTTIKAVLQDMIPDAVLNVPDIDVEALRFSHMTVFKALEEIRGKYGIDIYYRDGVLFAGLAYTETGLNSVKYHFQRNMPKDEASKLSFVGADDVKIKVRAVAIAPDGKQETVEVGDDDGDIRTLHYYGISKSQAMQQAQQALSLLKYSGYRGDITSFGIPRPEFGGVAELYDDLYPERAGKYLIDSVRTVYAVSTGFRRTVALGPLANINLAA